MHRDLLYLQALAQGPSENIQTVNCFIEFDNVLGMVIASRFNFEANVCNTLFTILVRKQIKWKDISVSYRTRLLSVLEHYAIELTGKQLKHICYCLAMLECNFADLSPNFSYELLLIIIMRLDEKTLDSEDFVRITYSWAAMHLKWTHMDYGLQRLILSKFIPGIVEDSNIKIFDPEQTSRLLFALAGIGCTGMTLPISTSEAIINAFAAILDDRKWVSNPTLLSRLCFAWVRINIKNSSSLYVKQAYAVENMLLNNVQVFVENNTSLGFNENCINILKKVCESNPSYKDYAVFKQKIRLAMNQEVVSVNPETMAYS